MAQFEFKFPDVGEGIHEGTIVKWQVKKGDKVKQDQILAEVETDKAVVEIPSPKTGTLLKLHANEGAVIKVGQVMVTLDVAGYVKEKEQAAQEKGVGVVGKLPETEADLGIHAQKISMPNQSGVKATPFVRKLAEQMGVNLSQLKGTGPDGMITVADVKSVTSAPKPQREEPTSQSSTQSQPKVVKKYDMWGYVDHMPLKGMRKAIAAHMVEAAKAPVVTHTDEADVTILATLREKEKKAAEKKGIKLTYLPYIIKAVIESLKKHPLLNAELDAANEDIILKKYFNIGIAVDTGEGLVVPVVKGADKKDIYTIAKEIEELAKKAKEKKLDLMDMKGGTFTITNIGVIGGTFFTPILNSPEAAILGLGRLADKPVAKDSKVVIRKMLPLSLTFDHRVADGAEAARFVSDLIAALQSPEKLK
ncbi:MAG TPA: dihydrolipoamide acetyltransferase family protein [Candidatus Nanoarchaeia archaeon]|nr:dihydrolipoamide acetyltransferase family protein [Candidatus Nanoarchaeia archaeon]